MFCNWNLFHLKPYFQAESIQDDFNPSNNSSLITGSPIEYLSVAYLIIFANCSEFFYIMFYHHFEETLVNNEKQVVSSVFQMHKHSTELQSIRSSGAL